MHTATWVVVAWSLAGGLACVGVEEDNEIGTGLMVDAAAPVPVDSSSQSAGPNCVTLGPVAPLVANPADVLVVFDRSGSMESAFGDGTRYQVVSALLSDIVTRFAGHLRFGYEEFPAKETCATCALTGCSVSAPLVDFGQNNATVMTAALTSAAPVSGNTPTAQALARAHAYFDALKDEVASRVVLLVTDGVPNCTLSATLSPRDTFDSLGNRIAGPCFDALVEVHELVLSGVPVLVLGVGAELADDSDSPPSCLDALASAGRGAASPASSVLYTASDPSQLRSALAKVFGGIAQVPCRFQLNHATSSTASISVDLDGQRIPHDSANGWQLDTSTSPPGVVLTGAYCEQVQDFQVSTVKVSFACAGESPPVPK